MHRIDPVVTRSSRTATRNLYRRTTCDRRLAPTASQVVRIVQRHGTSSRTVDLETLDRPPMETSMDTELDSNWRYVAISPPLVLWELIRSLLACRSPASMGSPHDAIRHLNPLLFLSVRHPPLDSLVRRAPTTRDQLDLSVPYPTQRRATLVDRRLSTRRRRCAFIG